MTGEVSRFDQMTVQGPELFTTSKSSNQFQILVKIVILFSWTPPRIPETILGLEPMLTFWNHHWSEGNGFNLKHHLYINFQDSQIEPQVVDDC